MLTALYGGAFDPVHNGHLAVARAAAAALEAGVRLLPTGDPRHRAPAHASGPHRVAMLRLAVAGSQELTVDTREIDRAGASYSFDTLRELRGELGDEAPLALIVGADALLGLPRWHRWRELFGLAHFVVAERPGVDLDAACAGGELGDAVRGRWLGSAAALRAAPGGGLLRLWLPLQPESSSAVRAAVAAGASIATAVPPAVAAYIAQHGLYR